MTLHKKEYIIPEFILEKITMTDVICGSAESFTSQVIGGDDWGEDDDDPGVLTP